MGRTFSRTFIYKDGSDSNRLKVLTSKTNVKLQPNGSSYPTGAIALTETSAGVSGIYKNDDVGDGVYKLYIDDVYRSEFGIFYVADDDIAQYAKIAGGNSFSGDQSVTGNVAITADLTIGNDLIIAGSVDVTEVILALEMFVNAAGAPYTTNTPSYDTSLVWKSWVDTQIAAINLSPYQESSNFRRCIPNGTEETNKVYTTLLAASNSFSSPASGNNCNVHIPGTGSSTSYIGGAVGFCRDYVNFSAAGRHINIIFSDGATNSKITKFENCTIFFGANDYTTARTMSNKTFINCTIYAYKDTTYTTCTLINCRFIHSSTYKVYLTGSTTAESCFFNNEYDKAGLTTGYVAGCFGIDITTLPTDPTVPA